MIQACSGLGESRDGPPERYIDPGRIANAVPKPEPRSRSGNPRSYVVYGSRYYVMKSSRGYSESGIASWYGRKFHGRQTASGEVFDMYRMTAAHKTLPLPTYVEVINLENRRKVIVKVNDRGPFHGNRLIDLSYVAAVKLGITGNGTQRVHIKAIGTQALKIPQADNAVVLRAPQADDFVGDTTPIADQFYLQIGAFKKKSNAERLAKKMGEMVNDPVRIRQAQSIVGNVYRVWIGPFGDRHGVERVETRLANEGFYEAHIIVAK